jgi:hypothetical protein
MLAAVFYGVYENSGNLGKLVIPNGFEENNRHDRDLNCVGSSSACSRCHTLVRKISFCS